MLGAIAGDIIGSVYEGHPVKSVAFPLFSEASRFTDDTVMTIAIAYALLHKKDYAETLRAFGRRYPDAGYGALFHRWLLSDAQGAYNSWGNGAAMRVSPVGFAFASAEEVLEQARRTAAVTHDHPEGIKGAQATALAIFLARTGCDKDDLRREINRRFQYDLDRSLEAVRPGYRFDVSCAGSVPESLIAFFESEDVESAIRNAISLGGDADTMACIAGGVAHAYYGYLPQELEQSVRQRLPDEFQRVVDAFSERFGP